MAGAIKHMERSHRSHRSTGAEFTQFHRHAYSVAISKEQRKPIGQQLSSMLRRLVPSKEA